MVYPIAKLTLANFIKLWIKKIEGINNIPKNRVFIAAANHSSMMDDMLLPIVIVPVINKKLHIYVNSKYFNNFFLGKFLYWGGSIPVDVDKKDGKSERNKKAFKQALNYLQNKEPVGIFPEGHRSIDGKLQKAWTGVAKLALTSKKEVLPVAFIGTDKILPKGKFFPTLKKCTMKIGKPLSFEKYYNQKNNKIVLRKVTDTIMKEIAKLLNKKYLY